VKLSEPWAEGFTINKGNGYGWRIHPITKKKKFHHGIDVAMPVGSPLTAPADGVIAHKGSGASGGYTLIVKHDGDLYSVYYHLKEPSHLNKGTRVERGERIAWSGNTGASTGPHLHFELRHPTRTWGQTIDPTPYFEDEPSSKIEEEPEKPVVTEPKKPVISEPDPKRTYIMPRHKPMSARLRRFFDIRRALR